MAAAVSLGSWSAIARAAVTLALEPSKDNSLYEDVLGSVSNGAGEYLFVGQTNRGGLRRAAVAFDLASALPANATITSATFTLTLSNSGPTTTSDVMLHRFARDWGEGTSNAGTPGGTGAPSTIGDATWAHAFYDATPWTTPGGDFSPMMSASRTIGDQSSVSYDFTSPQLLADVQGWLANPSSNFGWALIGDESRFGTARRFNSRENLDAASRPKLTIVYDVLAAGSTWNVNGGGAWGTATNWSGGVPDGPGAEAKFLDKLTPANAPATITLGGDRTAGKLMFDNANTYAIDGAAGQRLTLDNGANTGVIDVRGGTHVIRAQFRVAGTGEANVDSRLNAPGGIVVAAGKTFTKRGAGTLDVGDGAGTGVQLEPGARLEVESGTLSTGNVRGGTLEIHDARVNIKPDGTSAGTSVLDDLEFDGQGTLDLADNDLVVRATAATRQSLLEDVVARIKTARNAAAGRWKGPGITSSAAEANPLTTLAAMINPGLTTFGGEGIDANAVIIKNTYNGDANLDGRVNADDYFRIDQGFLAQPQNPTYRDGDFNYDGRVNADDYFLIDQAFLGQTGVLGVTLNAVAVPEPGGVIALFVGAASLLRRRRR
jgi:hypothetical protein